MKVVIDISEKIYDTIMADEMPTREQMSAIVTRIYQGTPLPKEHGRLIDAAALDEKRIDYIVSGFAESPEDCKEFGLLIINAPTIIEEEGEVEENGTN